MATNTPFPKPTKRKYVRHDPKTIWVRDPVTACLVIKPPVQRLSKDQLWKDAREAWFSLNPPNFQGYYQCALCPQMVHRDECTLDHIQTRSSRPDLKYDLENLQPAHALCNFARGSMSMEAWNAKRKDMLKSNS